MKQVEVFYFKIENEQPMMRQEKIVYMNIKYFVGLEKILEYSSDGRLFRNIYKLSHNSFGDVRMVDITTESFNRLIEELGCHVV